MAELAVWTFAAADRVARAERLVAATADERCRLDDAIVLTWPQPRTWPSYRRAYGLPLHAPLSDVLWGLLFGIIVYQPMADPERVIDSTADGLLTACGLGAPAVRQLRAALRPGRAAVLAVASPIAIARLDAALAADADAMLSSPFAVDGLHHALATKSPIRD